MQSFKFQTNWLNFNRAGSNINFLIKIVSVYEKSCIFQSTNALYMWECMYMEKSCLFCPPWGLGGGDGGISTARYVWQWKSRLQQFVQNRGRQSLLNMYIVCTSTWPLILRSLRSVMQLQIICVVSTHKLVIVSEGFKILALYLFVFFIVHISVHRVFVLIPLKKKNTFRHKCFVLSPTFLWHDVFCLICWDKSGLETPASVTQCERRMSLVSP